MRLASKIFLASSLVILVLVGVAAWSLLAVDRLVSVNREITTQTLPALRLQASLRDSMLMLIRLETRYLLLRDGSYEALWAERADHTRAALEQLSRFLASDGERQRLEETKLAFAEYRAAVNSERALLARGHPEHATALSETSARAASDRVDAGLNRLGEATQAALEHSMTEAGHLEARTWTAVVVALIVAVVAALVSAAVIAVRITRSVRRLLVATAAIAEGRFQHPVPIESADEIADLARSFNSMAARLHEVEAMKEDLYSTISHELRSPLTSVREAAHLLHEGVPGPLSAKQARLVLIIEHSTDRLLRLVNQVLDLARLRVGLLPLERRWFDLDRAAARAVDELRLQADERGLALVRDTSPGTFGMFGDEDRLVQVMINLISNGLRFTPTEGTVTVRLIDIGPEIEIQVEDTGSGIPTEELPFVFDRFRQAHSGRGGAGLGLAIVRAMVEAHGGRVSVESHEGKGSRFTVVLPRRGAEQ
jgi:signal transduction histidine kinase